MGVPSGYTSAQVVQAVPTGINSALVLINRTAISASSSQAFDNVFTSTYENYLILVQDCYGSVANSRLRFQYRYAGPTTQATAYYASFAYSNPASSAFGSMTVDNNATSIGLCIWNTSTSAGSAVITVQGMAVSTTSKPQLLGQVSDGYSAWVASGGGICDAARNYTGFILTPSAGNFTANVSVYGYTKS